MRDALRRLTARREAIALSDARVVRRALLRTTIVRLVLACMLVALAAAAAWRASNPGDRGASFLPPRATTVVVLDESRCVCGSACLRIAGDVHRRAGANVQVGR